MNNQRKRYYGYNDREEHIEMMRDDILACLKDLFKQYWHFIKITNRQATILTPQSSPWEAYLKWQEYELEARDKLDFTGVEDTQNSYLYRATSSGTKSKSEPIVASEIDVFKNYKGGLQGKASWDVRISNKAMNKLKGMKGAQVEVVLRQIFTLQLGYINDSLLIDTGPILYLAGFSKMIKNDQVIVFALAPERVPTIQYLNNEPVLTGFKYRQYLRIIDIASKNDQKSINGAYEGFISYIQQDPDKWGSFVTSQFMATQADASSSLSFNMELMNINNIIQVTQDLRYEPRLTGSYQLTKLEIKAFQFVKGRWISEMEQSSLSYSIVPNMVRPLLTDSPLFQKNINKEIIEKCTSQESCEWLLSFLEKIPNFTIKLTPEERLLITTAGNILCIGRSGTGKTTSAVLRLFALELLFKVRSSFFYKKDSGTSLKDSRNFTAEDAESSTGLHSVVVTASPVLTNEIRRFYQNFRNKIIEALKKKEQKAKQKSNESTTLIEDQVEVVQAEKEESKQEELEDELIDAEEVEKSLRMPHSMNDMKNDDFPAFLTIKRLVYMIDASLHRPFFVRNAKNQIIGQDSQAEWHNEQKGVLMINNYYKMNSEDHHPKEGLDGLERFMDLSSSDEDDEGRGGVGAGGDTVEDEVAEQVQKSKQKRNRKGAQPDQHVQEFAQEVDYELFEKKFWPKYGARDKLQSCANVWTQIYSVIKGSHNSADYPQKAIPQQIYIGQDQASFNERNATYKIFEMYEAWKKQVRGFDFMDIVNHILREISSFRYAGAPIHFMLVDEVQDLTPATIKLLLKVTEQNVYFAGDTAQTIARGVGFRFCDLKKMVNMTNFNAPKVLQLTVNFRSHNQILKLANSIIAAIEIFFPQTIDKLLKERSTINGLKPIVLDSALIESLFYILMGEKGGAQVDQQFGCDQVIIVRDQDAKKRIPSELQHALCLTVYEAKGLEFDDVILYNFFQDSTVGKAQWAVIHDIKVKKVWEKKIGEKGREPRVQTIEELEVAAEQVDGAVDATEYNEQRGLYYEYADKFYVTHDRENMQKDFAALCSELKQLYVCVTRPKQRLIIYDEDSATASENREEILKFWTQVGAVEVVTEAMVKAAMSNQASLTEDEKAIFAKIAEGQPHLKVQSTEEEASAKRSGWKAQGITMFKRRYFEQAIKCFSNAGEEQLQSRAKAYFLAEKGSKLMSEAEALNTRLTDFSQQVSKQERKALKDELKSSREQAIETFTQASQIFVAIGLKKQAAQCCFTSEKYLLAAELFEEIGFYAQAGEAYYILKDFNKAANLYSEGRAVTQAVECYKKMKNWDAILNVIKTNEAEFSQEQREAYIAKYVPLALNSLYHIVIQDNFNEGDHGEEEEEQQELLIGGKVIKDYEIMESQAVMNEDDSQVIEELDEESQIDTSSKRQNQSVNQSQGFDVISETDNKQQLESFEHLSQFDLEDEFLKSRPASVIDSLISGTYNKQDQKSELSCYSIISLDGQEGAGGNEVRQLIMQNVNLIRTKRDIYAEDIMMTKIVYYVSQFSYDVQSYLNKMRSKEVLLSHKHHQTQAQTQTQKTQTQNHDEVVQIDTRQVKEEDEESIYDIDNFDEGFINVILDCLESFELYKLCIIVCNRYKLRDRIGRYLVSIAHKYSNIPAIHSKYITLFHKDHKQVQEQVSFIAHHALHSALELIEPDYLKIKDAQMDQENSLGQYCYSALLSLGFWKKLIYLMNVQSGLSVTSQFSDFLNFRQIYAGFYKKESKGLSKEEVKEVILSSNFDFIKGCIDEGPSNEVEYLAYRTVLDQIVWEYNDNPTLKLEVKFPSFLNLCEMALKIQKNAFPLSEKEDTINHFISKLESTLVTLSKPNKGPHEYNDLLSLYDACQSITIFAYNGFKDHKSSHINILINLSYNSYKGFLRVLNLVLRIFRGKNLLHQEIQNMSQIIYGMLSVLKIKELIPCEAIYDNYGDSVLVHWKSPLAEELTKEVEDRKRKLTEVASQEVFSQNDVQFISKKALNKLIRDKLRTVMQNESTAQQLHIIDLDGNFMKVPLHLVIAKLISKLTSYVRKSANKLLQPNLCYFRYRQQIDTIKSPFDPEVYMDTLLGSLDGAVYISHFLNAGKDMKSDWKYTLQKKIEEPFIEKAKTEKETKSAASKVSQYNAYLLEQGLVTEDYLEEQLKQKQHKQQNRDEVGLRLHQFVQDIVYLAMLTFQPISNLEPTQRAQLLQVAQIYWATYIKSKTYQKQKEFNKDFDYALTAISLYIAAGDAYIIFLEQLQCSLGKSSPERKLLLTLLDGHIYKNNGDLMQCSQSLMTFLKMQEEENVMSHSFYVINYLEMAVVYTLLTNPDINETGLVIPFELCRHLCPFFEDMESPQRESFMKQIQSLNRDEEEVQFELQVVNTRFAKASDKVKYGQVLSDLIDLVCQRIQHYEKDYPLTHLFYMLMTIALNVSDLLSSSKVKMIFKALDKLCQTGIISENHSIFQYTSFKDYATEFQDLYPIDQNEVLFANTKIPQTDADALMQQSVFVRVSMKAAFSDQELRNKVDSALKQAELNEAKTLEAHQKAAGKIKHFAQYGLKSYLKRRAYRAKNSLTYSEDLLPTKISPRDLRLLIDDQAFLKQLAPFLENLKQLSKLNRFINAVIFTTTLDSVIDFHYLISQKEKAETLILPIIQQAIADLIRKREDQKMQFIKISSIDQHESKSVLIDSNNETSYDKAVSMILNIERQVEQWSQSKYAPNSKMLEKNQKIMKLKWREHAIKMKQKLISKVAGRKNQDYLQVKRERIKKYGL